MTNFGGHPTTLDVLQINSKNFLFKSNFIKTFLMVQKSQNYFKKRFGTIMRYVVQIL